MSSPKKIVSFKAKLVSDNRTYYGIVENLSKDSLYLRAVASRSSSIFQTGELLEVEFQPHSGKTICLSCKVKWSYKTPPHGLTNSLGMAIIHSLKHYEEFFNNLSA